MEYSRRLREARLAAGLTQADLARRAGTSQARLSSYETGSVIPNANVAARVLAAARPLPSVVLDRRRDEVKRLAGRHNLRSVRVFGSVARGADGPTSDVDLLVTPAPTASLLDVSAFADEAEDLLGCHVDVVSDRGLSTASAIWAESLAL